MPNFVRWLPRKHGARELIRLTIHNLEEQAAQDACREWMSDVQPAIDRESQARVAAGKDPRADTGWAWHWDRVIRPLLFHGGRKRKAALYRLSVGSRDRPAAMLAVLTEERWPLDPALDAVYVWYLSTAPDEVLTVDTLSGESGIPGKISQAALDVAITLSLNNPRTRGRVWLHADPGGKDKLMRWYGIDAMGTRIPMETHSRLPGFIHARSRANDQRYFVWTPDMSEWFSSRFDDLRR